VKTPSRAEFDLQVNLTAFPTSGGPPGLLALVGDHGFGSVDLLAYETGYRAQPLPSLSFDATAFFNTYTHLRTLESDAPVFRSTPAPPHLLFPLRFANLADGTSFGAEVAAHWRASQRWRLAIWYAYFDLNIHLDPASTDTEHAEGDAPRNQAFLQSVLGLRKSLSLDTEIYYVGRLPAQGVAEHVRTDLRLVWLPTSDLEMSVGMQNILGGNHQEFAFVEDGTQATFIEPAFDVRLTWRH
jgi:iron complex outermembrane receptor protein